ncbi:MAG TPA: hypothetical protein VKD90_08450 [Gemmataceae bacterium]|nr:hypothetical protein [Gemmataceae bacterium]
MSLNRWKVLACTLTVGVGGLAVFATPPAAPKTDAPKEPAPLPELTVKPPSATAGADTPAPAKPTKAEEFDLVVPDPVVTPASPTRPEVPANTKDTEPVFEPLTPPAPVLLPVSGTKANDVPKPDEPKKPDADKVPEVAIPPMPKPAATDPPKPVSPVPEVPKVAGSTPPAIDLVPPAASPLKVESPMTKPEPATPFAPPVSVGPAPAPPSPPTKDDVPVLAPATPPAAAPDAVRLPLAPAKTTRGALSATPARLKMLLRVGDGQPRFEIRDSASTELLLKVYGEKVEMQGTPDARSSLAGVAAIGRVRFTAPGIEGTCDHLSILSGTGEVLLKGNIHLKSKRGKAWTEMTAEKMVYQIGATGLASPGTRTSVAPASYIPD